MTDAPVKAEGRVRKSPMALDSDPSWKAAVLITGKGEMIVKSAILAILLKHGPLSDDDIHAHYAAAGGNRTTQRVRTARKALENDGLVREFDTEGVTSNGGQCARHVLVGDES